MVEYAIHFNNVFSNSSISTCMCKVACTNTALLANHMQNKYFILDKGISYLSYFKDKQVKIR